MYPQAPRRSNRSRVHEVGFLLQSFIQNPHHRPIPDQLSFPFANVPAVAQRNFLQRSVAHLCEKRPQPFGQHHVRLELEVFIVRNRGNVDRILKHGVIQNAVNVPSVSHDEYLELKPYVVLAERLGSFLAQVSDGTLEEISLRYSGHIGEWKTELIRNGAVMGILNEALEEKANLVNAAAIASARGLRIHESRKAKSSGGSGSVLSVLLKTSSEEHLVKGAVLHKDTPRLLHVDGIDVEAPLERNLIYMRNSDVPGVIGKVGTILGKHKINIAD